MSRWTADSPGANDGSCRASVAGSRNDGRSCGWDWASVAACAESASPSVSSVRMPTGSAGNAKARSAWPGGSVASSADGSARSRARVSR